MLDAHVRVDRLFLAQKNLPDVILANTVMTDGDGWEFLKEVKADDELAAISFIFVAAEKFAEADLKRASSLGADAVLNHPIEPEQLKREIFPFINIRLAEKIEREPQTPE